MIPASMENAQNMYAISLHKIEELVGEPPGEDAPESPIVHALLRRMLFELRQRALNRQQEVCAEPDPLPVIPVTGILNVGLRDGMDADMPHQDAFRSRMSASTSRHGRPAPGLRA